ncbi:glycosyltransferase [Actinopolymorpha alba]|uniref:glycosyltransferase n=1 Tax=Actinopolymorpha alba TaxID=533267 RepID=UPI00035EF413|nr:glycosyltransferase [Actinopolymorpha alba]
MRVLVASTGGAGHFNPLLPFVEAFTRRGDQVLLVVPPELWSTVETTGHPFRIGAAPPEDELAPIWERFPTAPPEEAAILANREIFGRLSTAAMLPALEDACREWQPDLVLREPCEYASAVAASRAGIPHAQVAISLADIEASSLALAAPALEAYGNQIVEQLSASPYLTRFPASLDPSPIGATRRFREAAAPRREPLPDWWDGDAAPLVYVTFGSVTGGLSIATQAYRAALDAVDGLPARVLLTVGRDTDASALGRVPANVHVEAWVPQGDVLGEAALVVCHGGSGTTFGTLAAGVPLVVVPMFADQPANARQISAAGAGVVVDPAPGSDAASRIGPGDAPRIRAAIESVLADHSYRRAAQRIADEMRALPDIDELIPDLLPDEHAADRR